MHLGDIAEIRRGTADPDNLALRDGRAALAVDVIRVDGAGTVAAAAGVEAAIARLLENGTMGDVKIEVLLNSATEIEAIYQTVRSTLIEGVALAVIIVFLNLNSWRSTVITRAYPADFLPWHAGGDEPPGLLAQYALDAGADAVGGHSDR